MIKHVCEAVQNGICGTVSKHCAQCFSGMCCPVFAIPERSRCFDLPASGSPKLYPSLLLAPTVGGRAPSSDTGSPTTPGLGAQLLLSQEPQSCRDPPPVSSVSASSWSVLGSIPTGGGREGDRLLSPPGARPSFSREPSVHPVRIPTTVWRPHCSSLTL